MFEQLYPCPFCGGVPKVGHSQRGVEQDEHRSLRNIRPTPLRLVARTSVVSLVRIFCSNCEHATRWVAVEEDETAALNEVGRAWNTRTDRNPVLPGTLDELIQREISAADIPLVLALLANTKGDWEERGPILAALAQRVIDASIVARAWWPLTETLEDAARYRKLVSRMESVESSDGNESVTVSFPLSPFTQTRAFELRIAAAVDALPDRKRW